MARLASQSKGGFYPTPVKEIQHIARGLRVSRKEEESNLVNILDPCCGAGEAVSILRNTLKAHGNHALAYGVELEKGRAIQAKNVLDQVIHEGYENIRTEPLFNMMWLNPPYDEVFHERTELRFLRTLTSIKRNVMSPNGLLLFCIPQPVLKDCAMILSSRFHNLKVYRFTDEEYPIFKQVIVIGYYGRPNTQERKDTNKMLRELSASGPEALPTTEEISEGEFVIHETEKEIELFRAGRLNIEELKKDLIASPVISEVEKRFTLSGADATMKNPLLPLKPTHGGIAVASGAIGGNMTNHIIVGVTKQITDKEEHRNDDGSLTHETYTKHFKSIVRVFSPEYGVVDLN